LWYGVTLGEIGTPAANWHFAPAADCEWIYSELGEVRRMASSGMLSRLALVRTDVSEELSASFFRVTRIGEIGITLAVTSNRHSQRASVASYS
jgi:hypothetical protein